MLQAITYKRIIKIQLMILVGLQLKKGIRICIQLNGTKPNVNDMCLRQSLAWKNITRLTRCTKIWFTHSAVMDWYLLGSLFTKGHWYLQTKFLTTFQDTGQRMEIMSDLKLEKPESKPYLLIGWLGQIIYNLLSSSQKSEDYLWFSLPTSSYI